MGVRVHDFYESKQAEEMSRAYAASKVAEDMERKAHTSRGGSLVCLNRALVESIICHLERLQFFYKQRYLPESSQIECLAKLLNTIKET